MNEDKNPALFASLWNEGVEVLEGPHEEVVTIDVPVPLGEPSPPPENDPAEDPEQQRSRRAWG